MTIAIFVFSLLGAMAIGIPIAFSLLICGVALMWHLDLFDAQILAQNVINGADAPPGLVSGPKILKMVRVPSSVRAGITWRMAG